MTEQAEQSGIQAVAVENTPPKRPAHRPSSYDPRYNETARKLCELGATDAQIADFIGIDRVTFYRWRNEFPDLCHALKLGKEASDGRVTRSLYHRAVGYEWEEQQAVKLKEVQYHANGKRLSESERIETITVQRSVPPDTVAAIFWLKNRQPDQWRDQRDVNMRHDFAGLESAAAVIDQVKKELGDQVATALMQMIEEPAPGKLLELTADEPSHDADAAA